MRFQTELVPATLIRRYKRFLADIRLEDGREVTAHCPNPGSMLGLAEPGMKIWVEPNDDPKKKLGFGWRLVDHQNGHFTGIDTIVPNRVVAAALLAHEIPELAHYENIKPEVKYGENSRVDFLLTGQGLKDAYVEVKSATLSRVEGLAEFPDSVTKRGAKHITELMKMVAQGKRGILFYLVQRTDCTALSVAADIDPTYGRAIDAAILAGVEVIGYSAVITPQEISIGRTISILALPSGSLE